jgi:hypothetical protein
MNASLVSIDSMLGRMLTVYGGEEEGSGLGPRALLGGSRTDAWNCVKRACANINELNAGCELRLDEGASNAWWDIFNPMSYAIRDAGGQSVAHFHLKGTTIRIVPGDAVAVPALNVNISEGDSYLQSHVDCVRTFLYGLVRGRKIAIDPYTSGWDAEMVGYDFCLAVCLSDPFKLEMLGFLNVFVCVVIQFKSPLLCTCNLISSGSDSEYLCNQIDWFVYDYLNNFRKNPLPEAGVFVQLAPSDKGTLHLTAVGLVATGESPKAGDVRKVSMEFQVNKG